VEDGVSLQFKDLTNQRFGKLIVISRLDQKQNGQIVWKCLCDCGNYKDVPRKDLARKHVKSCGCLRGLYPTKRDAGIATLYKTKSGQSKRREISFELTLEQFIELINGNCYYCNISPNNVYRNRQDGKAVISYNGIDRIDSKIGYTIENCKSCCKTCNISKGSKSEEEFKEELKVWVKNAYDYLFGKKD
jgi:hypothetical protein